MIRVRNVVALVSLLCLVGCGASTQLTSDAPAVETKSTQAQPDEQSAEESGSTVPSNTLSEIDGLYLCEEKARAYVTEQLGSDVYLEHLTSTPISSDDPSRWDLWWVIDDTKYHTTCEIKSSESSLVATLDEDALVNESAPAYYMETESDLPSEVFDTAGDKCFAEWAMVLEATQRTLGRSYAQFGSLDFIEFRNWKNKETVDEEWYFGKGFYYVEIKLEYEDAYYAASCRVYNVPDEGTKAERLDYIQIA